MLQSRSSLQDIQETYRWFEHKRRTQPVWLDESSDCWHVVRYADVNNVITDYHVFSSEIRRPVTAHSSENAPVQGRSILSMDPPQHRLYRNLVSPAFTPRALARLTDRIAAISQELLDQVRPNGKMDVVTDFAYPLPTTVIAEMLGVPTSDRLMFKRWADELLSRQLSDAEFFKPDGDKEAEEQRIKRLFDEMSDYFKQMLEERRHHPRADMMSDLLVAEVEGEHLSMDDTISFCILLLLAGHVTTTNLLSQAIRCFDEHPDAMEQLRRQPELMPDAIEEVLRYASPVWRLARKTKTDTTIDDVTIPGGSLIFAWLASANRDGEQFSDPNRFDITRTPNRHVAFGHGIHFCIGAPLSRLEVSIALPMMLAQLPNLQLVRDKPLELYEGRFLFGFKHLPVTFTASNIT